MFIDGVEILVEVASSDISQPAGVFDLTDFDFTGHDADEPGRAAGGARLRFSLAGQDQIDRTTFDEKYLLTDLWPSTSVADEHFFLTT